MGLCWGCPTLGGAQCSRTALNAPAQVTPLFAPLPGFLWLEVTRVRCVLVQPLPWGTWHTVLWH